MEKHLDDAPYVKPVITDVKRLYTIRLNSRDEIVALAAGRLRIVDENDRPLHVPEYAQVMISLPDTVADRALPIDANDDACVTISWEVHTREPRTKA